VFSSAIAPQTRPSILADEFIGRLSQDTDDLERAVPDRNRGFHARGVRAGRALSSTAGTYRPTLGLMQIRVQHRPFPSSASLCACRREGSNRSDVRRLPVRRIGRGCTEIVRRPIDRSNDLDRRPPPIIPLGDWRYGDLHPLPAPHFEIALGQCRNGKAFPTRIPR
jgi:hypothetical protein